jgi:MFS family permease
LASDDFQMKASMNPTSLTPPKSSSKLPASVVTLGWVSFFTDMASEMIYPLIPLFVVQTLGASPALLGLIDGVAEGIGSGLRWFGGAWSDRIGKRKPFVFAGYTLSALSKPVMGMAATIGGWPVFMAGRCSDRLGKSIRTSARDALIADSTGPSIRGAAFGLHRAMDTAGAVVGPLICWFILHTWPKTNLAWIFIVALLPGLASAGLIAVAVPETSKARVQGNSPGILQRFPKAFWLVLIVMGVFSLANSSDAFLILRSSEMGLTSSSVILVFALYNVVYALASAPFGALSDRIGRRSIIVTGWFVYALVYLGFGLAQGGLAPWILLAVYGLYQAMTDGVSKALVSDIVPAHQRAGAIGLIYAVAGFGQLFGSILAGVTWNHTVPGTPLRLPFAIAAAFAVLAGLLLLLIPRVRREPAISSGA